MFSVMDSLLKQLSSMTVVVADTGDIEAIKKFRPRDATTNPSLILSAAKIPAYKDLINEALKSSRKTLGVNASNDEVVNEALDQVCVFFGKEILKVIPGRVSTEVDARLSFDENATINKARKLINLYNDLGINKDRVLIKVASTWQGIKAAETLEKEGIHCNLTLLFNFYQAVACADAGVTLISPFVGRILDWYKAASGIESYPGALDPGVVSVTKIFNYFKSNNYKTEVMGASFRNIDEIRELAGCDLLTIAPKLLEELTNTYEPLNKKLDYEYPAKIDEDISLDQTSFELMMAGDRMASEKLDEGIKGFCKAIESLEVLLHEKLSVLDKEHILA
tara:strand:+ start:318 stop:1325 length:1008 start_codon:yes stop_codon:yes gene_type:complete